MEADSNTCTEQSEQRNSVCVCKVQYCRESKSMNELALQEFLVWALETY